MSGQVTQTSVNGKKKPPTTTTNIQIGLKQMLFSYRERCSSWIIMEDTPSEVRRCCLCLFLTILPADMQTHFEEAHPGEGFCYHIIAMPSPQQEPLGMEQYDSAQVVQHYQIDSTVGREFKCTQCQWSCTDRDQMKQHIFTSDGHQAAWFTGQGDITDSDSSDEESD